MIKITSDEQKIIAAALQEGKSYSEIGLLVGRTKNQIFDEVWKGGGPKKYVPSERPMKFLSPEEKRAIERELKNGKSHSEIAALLNRTYNTIKSEIKRNGGRENYCAQKSISHSQDNRHGVYQSLTEEQKNIIREGYEAGEKIASLSQKAECSTYKVDQYVHSYRETKKIEERLEALESHIEILFDLIKKG